MDWHVLDGNHTSSDPPGGYYTGQGSALDAFWQPAINARLGVALITSIPVGATTYWAVNGTTTGAPVAQLSEVHEFNDSYTKNLTVAADFGQKSMLALYDILAAGHFTGITAQTPVGSPFARRVA
jgi:hypothetical protein